MDEIIGRRPRDGRENWEKAERMLSEYKAETELMLKEDREKVLTYVRTRPRTPRSD